MTANTGISFTTARTKPRIGVTIGDPAGIGPEVALKAVLEEEVLAACAPVLIGDAQYLSHWARVFGLNYSFDSVNVGEPFPLNPARPIVYNLNILQGPIELGREHATCGLAAAQFIEAATQLCLSGQIDAITTAPINKKSLHLAGYNYPGHTEFLARLTQTDEFAMTFITPRLRVSLLTTHVPLADVPSYVKKTELEKLIRLVHRELRVYGLDHPRIAVAALNPHGGKGIFLDLKSL